jgi:AraC-like DNA-binding protein
VSVRHFRASLAAPPEVRTSGAFGTEDSTVAWQQPGDQWHVHWPSYAGVFSLNGHSTPFEPHTVFIVPPGSRCAIQGIDREVYVYCYFSFVPVDSERDIVTLPFATALDETDADRLEGEYRKCLNRLPHSRTSVQAFVWSLLWSLGRPEHVLTKSVYTEQAERLIEERLSRRFLVRDLAEELQISQSQLARHFMQDHGRTPLQYVRDRRALLAHRLLTRSATPIKQVAAQCGVPDANQFCRFVKERFGASPRELRKARGSVDVFRERDLKAARAED